MCSLDGFASANPCNDDEDGGDALLAVIGLPSEEDKYVAREAVDELLKPMVEALLRVPKKYRCVIVRRFGFNVTIAKLVEETGLARSTIYEHIEKGLQLFGQEMQSDKNLTKMISELPNFMDVTQVLR